MLRPDPTEPKRLELHPSRPLPIHAQITLAVSETLTGLEGPLNMGTAIEVPVETYGPLTVNSVNCDRQTPHQQCSPGGAWSLELSNPVPLKDLKRALSVTPPIALRFENWTDESTPVTYLSIAAPFQAGQKYTLSVSGDLHDVHGQSLGKTFSKPMAIDDYFPAVEIGVQGKLLDPRAATAIPIGSVNVKHYVLSSAALTPENAFALEHEANLRQRFQFFQGLPQAHQQSVVPGATLNHIRKENLGLSTVLGSTARGAVAIGVEYEHHPKDYRSLETFKIVKVTDLALTAKLSRDGSLVWVTRLSSGEPVAKATVSILGESGLVHEYQTDAQGIALIPAADFKPRLEETDGDAEPLLVVKSGDDWTYERVRDYLSPWRLSVPFDGSGKRHTYGLIFTERGLYRPGDDVQVKGILRRELPSGNRTPQGDEIKLELFSPDSEQVQTQTLRLNKFGTFAAHFKVPETGHLGAWQIRASGLDDTIYESFDVSEYRPAEFKVGVESEKPSYVRGDTARWTGRGDYLFGAPMSAAAVRVTVSRAPSSFEVPGSAGFSTSASAFHADLEEASLSGGELLSQNAKLDAHGSVSFTHKLELPGQVGPELLTAEADVTDVSRQSIAGSTSAIVHPAEFYLGLKEPEDYFAQAPGRLTTQVLALSLKGEKLAGKSVKVEMVSRRWTYAREAQAGGDSRLVSKVIDRVVSSCSVTTALAPASRARFLDLPEAGYRSCCTPKAGQGQPRQHGRVGARHLWDRRVRHRVQRQRPSERRAQEQQAVVSDR